MDDPRIAGGYIGCCFGAGKYDWVKHKYERDWLLGKKQIEIEARFWLDYIAAGVEPPLSGNADLDLAVVYGYNNVNPNQGTTAFTACSSTLPPVCEALFEEYQRLSHNKKVLTSARNTAYNEERNIKTAISLEVPEGLTVIQQPDELSYRVSLKHSQIERVNEIDLLQAYHQAGKNLSAITVAMTDVEIDYNLPKVVVAKRAAKKSTKKGA